ncbi:MAG: thiamine pyrophosphate-dependent enzyme, partial [Actinopolymorphaceae bacterium]
ERDTAVLGYFGDGASAQGDVNEAFIWAAVFNAPIVFFLQNNQWAISAPMEKQSRIPLYRRAAGFGFPGVRVDGNDVLACYAVAKAALQQARDGGGPTLVEAFTYRMGAHTTTDDPTRYRLKDELERWKLKDPLARVKAYLSRNGVTDDDFFVRIEAEADALAAHVREGTHAMPEPDYAGSFDHVYAEQTEELAAQQQWVRDYHASFADTDAEADARSGVDAEFAEGVI